jgi:hypothetical protein
MRARSRAAPRFRRGDQSGAIVRGKRFLALTAATATTAAAAATTPTAEDAAAAASANDHFRGAGLNHGQTLSPNPLRLQYDSK